MKHLFRFAVLIFVFHLAHAEGKPGITFSYHDWELACDNTGTCRMAGYHGGEDDLAISVLFTRKAGPGEPVTGRVMIGQYGENADLDGLPAKFPIMLRIDNRDIGRIQIEKSSMVASLDALHVARILGSLVKDSRIEFAYKKMKWHLSDKGAAAVLLKMDEFQGRVGTPGALFRKGNKSEETILKPVAAPVLIRAPLHKKMPGDDQFSTTHAKGLLEALRKDYSSERACDERILLDSQALGTPAFETLRLTDKKMLVYGMCWSAAYNFGYGYWVVNTAPPYDPVLVTESGPNSPDADGGISASHKGRGLGDCWSANTWAWDGKQYIHTESFSSGMCKLVAPGGAWKLPTIVMDVR